MLRSPGTTHWIDRDDHEAYSASDVLMMRVSKKAACRLLDGVQHDGFPEMAA
ncbi:hypothetical protein PO002_37630 [Cupriavidus necator]|uniref:hypothetical protein n=1 Tax=Cupriavidus necator TaxID=106590 RepID=UPI0039C414D1